MADGDSWVSDDDLAKVLGVERRFLFGEGPVQAMAILNEASPAAALQVVKLALQGDSETVRLRASTYILDKTTGEGGDGGNPWDDIVGATVKDAEQFLAQNSTGPPKGTDSSASEEDG